MPPMPQKFRLLSPAQTLSAVLVLSLALACGALLGRASAAPAPTPPPAKAGPTHMVKAFEHLKAAKAELDKADPDAGGHRAEAVRLVADALIQVERGIRFDTKR